MSETSEAKELPASTGFSWWPNHGLTWLAVAGTFVVISLIQVPVPGINEPHYLSKARAFADSGWCAGDLFLSSSDAHFVFFLITAPLTEVLSLECVAVIGRVVSLALLAFGWQLVCVRLGLGRFGTILSAALFCGIALTGNMSGEWVVGGYKGKVPAYGLSLIAVAVWMDARTQMSRRRYLLSGLTFGAAASLHPVVGIWFCVGVALAESYFQCRAWLRTDTRKTRGPIAFLGDGLTFTAGAVVAALPGIIPAALIVLKTDLPADRQDYANYVQVFWRLAHHLDPTRFPVRAWIHTSVLIALLAVTHLVWRRSCRRVGEYDGVHDDERNKLFARWATLFGLLVAAGVISVSGIIIGQHETPVLKSEGWQWRADLLKFYPFRFFDAFLPMTVSWSVAVLAGRLLQGPRIRFVAGLVTALIVTGAAWNFRAVAPPGYSAASFAAWKDACGWIRVHTPGDSLVFGPREGFGFNWYAERPQFVCFKDCPQDAAGILEWNSRLNGLYKWSRAAYRNEIYDDDDLQQLREKYGITHVLTRRLGPFESRPIYENSFWRLYEIP